MVGNQVTNLTAIMCRPELSDLFSVAISQTFVVTNANDSGAGSLRDALNRATSAFTDDRIVFDSNYFSTTAALNC